MTQVCQHYAHTFKKFKFHFHFESDPTFDRLAQFVWSKNACTPKMVKIAMLILDKSKFSKFLSLLLLFSFDWSISKTRQDAGLKLCLMIAIHDRWCKSILIFFVNNKK